jgi:hypothetical protein
VDLAGFECARDPEMVEFLQKAAEAASYARTYVLATGSMPIGYYTLSAYSIGGFRDKAERHDLLAMPTPMALIGRLARDDRAPRGAGVDLLVDALGRIVEVHQAIAFFGACVQATGPELLEKFYQPFGFKILDKPVNARERLVAYMPIAEVENALAAHG